MATQSYRERMKAQQADAKAKREQRKLSGIAEPSCGTKSGSWRSTIMRSVEDGEARKCRAKSCSFGNRNATSGSKGRRGNDAYRVREHLTEAEMDKLRAAFKCNRHGHRDWLIKLVIYRHGLRISQTCNLRWDDIDLPKRTNWCRSVPGPKDQSGRETDWPRSPPVS